MRWVVKASTPDLPTETRWSGSWIGTQEHAERVADLIAVELHDRGLPAKRSQCQDCGRWFDTHQPSDGDLSAVSGPSGSSTPETPLDDTAALRRDQQ